MLFNSDKKTHRFHHCWTFSWLYVVETFKEEGEDGVKERELLCPSQASVMSRQLFNDGCSSLRPSLLLSGVISVSSVSQFY